MKHIHLSRKLWGTFAGKEVFLFRLVNEGGAYVELTNYGATFVSVVVPDKYGKFDNVILGYSNLQGYLQDTCYIGSTIGRFANRIHKAQFELDGVVYQLEKNDGSNTNHGGLSGFHAQVFNSHLSGKVLVFDLLSEDGQEGYPGNLKLSVEYSWTDHNELCIQYTASTDRKTIANFTNHAYFNLAPDNGNIFDYQLRIHASEILETTRQHIPTGRIVSAGNIAFEDHRIAERIKTKEGISTGLNTNYLFDKAGVNSETALCSLRSPATGRVLDIYTSYPGVQLYTGDFLSSSQLNNRSMFHKPFDGLCLECQFYPDSPNHPHFPSTELKKGERYNEKIVYKFTVEE